MRQLWLTAIVGILGAAAIAACGSTAAPRRTGTVSATTTAAAPTAHAVAVAASGYPVYQLPPGHVILAQVATPEGLVAIDLHRIRYFGHVSLCLRETAPNGSSESQSCANYPVGPRSNQGIGNSPVWWAGDYIDPCVKPLVQTIAGVVLHPGLTAWLHVAGRVSRMPAAAVPGAFGVSGPLLYAVLGVAKPAFVTLRNVAGRTVYRAPVASLGNLPSDACNRGASATTFAIAPAPNGGYTVTRSSTSAFVLVPKGSPTIP
jgi:hypothetical protein